MKALGKNVLVKVQMSNKENYNLTEDITIKVERGYNFNRREDYPTYGIVIHSANEKIPIGAECLLHHNSTEESYRVVGGEKYLTLTELTDGYRIFSVDKDMVFVYRNNGEWLPCEDFLITKRIFKPYKGKLLGVGNQKVENRLYIVKGSVEDAPDLEGKVCAVTKNSDYEIIYHNKQKKEERLIRTRSREIEAIDDIMLSDLKKGKYLLGISSTDCKTLKI